MNTVKTTTWILRAEKDTSPYTSLDCFESGELASKTRYQEVSVSICIIQSHAYEEEEVRVARAARFYRFRASACSRAAANCSLMQASERASERVGALLFLGVRRRKASLNNIVNDENAILIRRGNSVFGIAKWSKVRTCSKKFREISLKTKASANRSNWTRLVSPFASRQ